MLKYLKHFKCLMIVAFSTTLSFILGIGYTYSPWSEGRTVVINTVLKYPKYFPFSTHRRKFLISTVAECKNLTKKNWKDTLYGDNFETAKDECMDKVARIIRNGLTETSLLDSGNGKIAVNIGNVHNPFNLTSVISTKFTEEEDRTYTANIKKIIDAIPNNIPDSKTLKKVEIIKVRFYDHYAKIKYSMDYKVDDLAEKGIPYKGQY